MTVETIDEPRLRDLDLFGEDLRQNWEQYSREWSTSEPFCAVDRGIPHFVCGRYNDVRALFLARGAFSVEVPREKGFERYDMFGGVKAVTHLDGEAHDRLRRLLQPTFGPARIEGFRTRVQQVVDGILDDVEAKGEFDAVADFSAQLMPRLVLGSLLGLPEERHGPFLRRHEISPLTMNVPPGGEPPREFREWIEDARRAIDAVIAEREQSRDWGDDFVGSMLRARAEGVEVSDDEIFANFFVIGGAAGTTTTTASTMLMLLCRHRDQFEKLRANLDLVPDAVEECLRLHPAGLFVFTRVATRDVEIGGVRVPAGTLSYPCVTAAHIDPTRFPDPLRFDIERQPGQTLAFGLGAHYCMGALLARRVLQIALRSVVTRFPDLDLVDPDFRPTYSGNLGELRPVSMPMCVR